MNTGSDKNSGEMTARTRVGSENRLMDYPGSFLYEASSIRSNASFASAASAIGTLI